MESHGLPIEVNLFKLWRNQNNEPYYETLGENNQKLYKI